MNAESFLQKYRVLEGLLEKRYEGVKTSAPSVVMEYLRDPDSQPVRVELDLLREIRNILSHNAGPGGEPVVEPSAEMLRRLDEVIAYIRRPRRAADFGTPAERVYSANPNDRALHVMRGMCKNGYSHVPVMDGGRMAGVFSARGLLEYLAERGLDGIDDSLRVRDLGKHIRYDGRDGERYVFVSAQTSIVEVRNLFQKHTERNRRLSAVFVTENGVPGERLICMLTPWDVLSDHTLNEETRKNGSK